MANNPKLPVRGYEGIPLEVRDLVRQFTKCCRKTCIARGRWLPVLLIRLQGQIDERETVRLSVPILLCDKCKEECRAADIIQEKGWGMLSAAVFSKSGKLPNRDTLSFDWRDVGPKLPLPKLH